MSDPITRLNAALEGRYRIEHELGEGGMATVYLARDEKHNRNVALKVLKPELAAVVGAERFLAEIETTANLQHPHILPLFDSGEADSFLFYVMPYVEGESLREKLDREKQLGVDEALDLTKKVAGALDYAHGNGVVHRDIKPGNVLLSQQGEPLVADFGIALAVAQAGGGRITETGLSLGTPHYMSPEQATGDRAVDPRSDVYALGCVLYEMLAGEPPFSATTAQAILAKILTMDAPSITMVRRTVPPNVGSALAKALEKLPADRFTSAAEFSSALTDRGFTYEARARTAAAAQASAAVVAPGEQSRAWHRDRRLVTSLLAGVTMTGFAAWGWLRPPPPPTQPVHATRLPIDLGDISLAGRAEVIVSPDGSRFAVVGTVDGQTALYWRDASEETFRVIPGTQSAREAAFSPEGDWIVYSDDASNALLKVSLSGGAPTPVVRSGSVAPFAPYWGDEGTIVFSSPSGLYRVPDTGGEPVSLGVTGGTSASLLPGGEAVLFARSEGGGIMVLDLAADSVQELVPDGLDPVYVETGHVLYVDGSGGLWALPFDATNLEVVGGAVPILDGLTVFSVGTRRYARLSVSRNGTLVYGVGGSVGGAVGGHQLVVVDLEGNEKPLALTPRVINQVGWSPDGRSIVYSSAPSDGPGSQIYTYDTVLRTTPRQLTFEGTNFNPVFSPDGTRVAFNSNRVGTDGQDLFVKELGDDSPPRSIITLEANQFVSQWPSDSLIVFEWSLNNNRDLWTVDLSDPDNPRAQEYLGSEFDLRFMVVSPDGTLAAYRSNESGQVEIYIRSFPEPGGLTIMSQGGGNTPFWSPDGNTLYYLSSLTGLGEPWMAVRLQRNPVPVVLGLDTLFATNIASVRPFQGSALHPDGERFIIARAAETVETDTGASEPERFLVVTNWFEELRERMGEN